MWPTTSRRPGLPTTTVRTQVSFTVSSTSIQRCHRNGSQARQANSLTICLGNHARSGTIAIPGARLHNYYGKDVARPTLPNDHARPRHSSRSTSGCPADCEGRCSDPELQFALEFDCRKARCTPPTSAPPREEEKALQNRTWTVAANRHRKPEGRSGLGDGCEW